MSKFVPDGWSAGALTEFADLKHGFQFRTPDFSDFGIKVIKIGQVIGNGKIELSTCDYVRQDVYENRKNFSLRVGDILMSLTGNIGRVGIVPELAEPLLQNYRVGLFEPNNTACFKWYLFHLLSSEFVTSQLLDKSNTTAQANFGKSDLDQVLVSLPPIPEQHKIAAILTAVDEVIASTQAQINKLKDLKTGMMQELLTKGIGHTEFKDSPVGQIPGSWKFLKIDDLVTKVGSGITPQGGSAVYTQTGVPFIRSQNVYSEGLRWGDVCFISKEQHRKMSNSQLKPKDVLLNITGASIGRCHYLPDDFIEGNVNQHVCIIRCEHKVLQHIFLAHFINSDFGQHQIMNLQAGGNREGLNFQQIRAMGIPVPPLSEQISISEIISSAEKNIAKRTNKLNAHQKIKKALMQDLLTGKVRVNVN